MDLQHFVHLLGPWSAGKGPLYRRLTTALHALLQRGDIAPGTRLPAERLLAEALAISRSTVIAAYRLLEQEQWLERKPGSGSWIRPLPFGRTYVAPVPTDILKAPWHLSQAQERQLIDFSVGTPGDLADVPASLFHLTAPDVRHLMTQRGYTPQGWLPLRQVLAVQVLQQLDHIWQARQRELQRKFQVMTELVSTLLPGWTWQHPEGGYFLWLRLPNGNAPEFAQVALRRGVVICPGTLFSVDASHQTYVRSPFLLDEETLQEGMKHLAQAWEAYLL
jgi:DNA-binding transcriptional MocR family regulator